MPIPLLLAFLVLAPQETPKDLVLCGGTVHDGSGAGGREADVLIRGGRIAAVGEVGAPEATVVDCSGLVIAPGFLDLHNHSDRTVARPRNRDCASYLTQGCTTLVTGNCGNGHTRVAEFFAALEGGGVGCNIAHLVPHGSIRREIMGEANRAPTAGELAEMKERLESELQAGAVGMSTGLYYVPGAYANEDEIIALCKVVAEHGGIWATHQRHEDERILESIAETIRIAEGSGVTAHLSHFKARGRRAWGKVRQAAEAIEAARARGVRLTADQYPYVAASSSLSAYLFPPWAREGGTTRLLQRLADATDGPRIRAAVRDRLEVYPDIRIATGFRKEWIGKSLAAIAEEEERDVLDVVLGLVRNGGAGVVNFAMSEDDVRYVMKLPWVAAASDGMVTTRGPRKPHPRSFGTFPRRIGRYALRENVQPLAAAVRSATGLPASILGLKTRGLVRAGWVADLVVFDPERLEDRATFAEPYERPAGVVHVLIGGRFAVRDGDLTEEKLGRPLRLQDR